MQNPEHHQQNTHIAKRVAQSSECIQPSAMWNQRALLYLHKWIIPLPAKPVDLLPHSLTVLLASKQNSVDTTPELSETVPSPDCEEFEPAPIKNLKHQAIQVPTPRKSPPQKSTSETKTK